MSDPSVTGLRVASKAVAVLVWAVVFVRSASPSAAQDILPQDWGPIWQVQLPDKERHPSLFFDESDRTRMLERTKQRPTDYWTSSGFATTSASTGSATV